MKKYVFKNPEVEKALRLVSKELGVSDEKFDEDVQRWGRCSTIYIEDEDRNTVVDFPSILLKEHNEFNPNGWNESDVIPPVDDPIANASTTMLAEDKYGDAKKVFYDFNNHVWREAVYSDIFDCKRYRLYPSD